MSIEDLMSVRVESASRVSQSLVTTPAAAYVITADDIRRSSARTIPDLLRMVPGVQVSQIDGNKWMVAVRGFNGRFSNKLQVLVDGQSIYSPLFSGVFWDDVAVSLEEIERIEVIRGPGGAVWGANAVNGVINIITERAAAEDKTVQLSGGGANAGRLFARSVGVNDSGDRFGALAVAETNTGLQYNAGSPGPDRTSSLFGSFRWAKDQPSGDSLDFRLRFSDRHQGDRMNVPTLAAPFSERVDERYDASSWNFLGAWRKPGKEGSETRTTMYFGGTDRNAPEVHLRSRVFGLAYQQTLASSGRQRLNWGADYRTWRSETSDSDLIWFSPSDRTYSQIGFFLSDAIKVGADSRVILSGRLETETFGAWHLEPSARFVKELGERRTFWAAASVAKRANSRADVDVLGNLAAMEVMGTPAYIRMMGNDGLSNESATVVEVGYREQPNDRLGYDVAAFVGRYRNLRTLEPEAVFPEPGPIPHLVVPYRWDDNLSAQIAGVDGSIRWDVTPGLRLELGASFLESKFELGAESLDPFGIASAGRQGAMPRWQGFLNALWRGSQGWSANATLRAMDRLPGGVPGYVALDLQVTRRDPRGFDFDLALRNLFAHRHLEAITSLYEVPGRVPFTLEGRLTWRF